MYNVMFYSMDTFHFSVLHLQRILKRFFPPPCLKKSVNEMFVQKFVDLMYQNTKFHWTNFNSALIWDNKQTAELDAPLPDNRNVNHKQLLLK